MTNKIPLASCRDGEKQTCKLKLKSNEWSPEMSKNACRHDLVGTKNEKAKRV